MSNYIAKELVHWPLRRVPGEILLIKISSVPVINLSCLYSFTDTGHEQEYPCVLVQMNSPASMQYTVEKVK